MAVLVLAGFLVSLGAVVTPMQVLAETNACGIQIEIGAAPFATVDSNNPGVEGPKVAMLSARIVNTSGAALENVQVHIGNGVTPGVFTATNGAKLGLVDSRDATHLMASMDAGESVTHYWPVTYPATFNVAYGYTVWATTPANCSTAAAGQITTQSEISASANKMQPSGGVMIVSPQTTTPGGQLTVQISGFSLGTIGQGPRPLSPADAWMQPIGNLDFDPTCMRLVRSEVKLSSISATPFVDQLYYRQIGSYRESSSDYVKYTFLALRECSTNILPYQEAASGTQEKYNSDYSIIRLQIASVGQSRLNLDATADKTTATAGATIGFSANISSTGAPMGSPSNGSPVVVESAIPVDTAYVAGSAVMSAPGSIQYSSDGGVTWQNSEPANSASVTTIRWIYSDPVNSTTQSQGYAVTVKATYAGAPIQDTFNASLLGAGVLATDSVSLNGSVPTPTPTATPTPSPTPTPVVQSGEDGGLESGPLPLPPSTFLGAIGDEGSVSSAAVSGTQAVHKARLQAARSLSIDDILPETGPTNTTRQMKTPSDVLAITTAPQAEAADFVDASGSVHAVAMAVLSVGAPYEHDYGVCNRFKEYSFEDIQPLAASVNGVNAWFWSARSVKGAGLKERVIVSSLFVDEQNKQIHLDSRWVRDDYGSDLGYRYDYVFNLQLWSSDLANSTALLQQFFAKLALLQSNGWQLAVHNQSQPVSPVVFVVSARYAADRVTVTLRNRSTVDQDVRLHGAWRTQLDRSTLIPVDNTLLVAPGDADVTFTLSGLLDTTLLMENNGFTDKIYTGGGLWFAVQHSANTKVEIVPGLCRVLDNYDSSDLILAGCMSAKGSSVGGPEDAGLGRTLNPNGRAVDISPYQALHFWAKGDGRTLRIILETQGVQDGDYHQVAFIPDNQWREYFIPLSQFAQRGFGAAVPFTGTDVRSVIWLNAEAGSSTFDLALGQVSFTNQSGLRVDALPGARTNNDAQVVTVQGAGNNPLQSATLLYSLDDGVTFVPAAMGAVQAASGQPALSAMIPGQPNGADVNLLVEAVAGNGYVVRTPFDAPASFHRYAVDDRDGLLVDDFAAGRLLNRLQGSASIFNSSTGGQLQVYRHQRQLVLNYAVPQAGQFAGYFSQLNKLNAAAYTTLDLLVRGEAGGEQLYVGLRDVAGEESYVSAVNMTAGGIRTEWHWLQVPMSSFAMELDRTALQRLILRFNNQALANSGRIYVKEIRFTTLVAPILVDSFEDGDLTNNSQGKGSWVVAPNSTLAPSLQLGDTAANRGTSLRLDYAVSNGGYALWGEGLNHAAVAADSVLTLWVKGANQAIVPNLYLGDGVNRARVNLGDFVTLSDKWQAVRIPLAAFTAQGGSFSRLTSFEIAFEFAAGSGSLWIDNISIGRPGSIQTNRRVLYLNDTDSRALALHMSDGVRWSASFDQPWLVTQAAGSGPAAVTIDSAPWDLAPGKYTGLVTFRAENGATETVTVHLTVTSPGATAQRTYLPLVSN